MNIFLNVVDWLGISFAIIYCAVDPDNQYQRLLSLRVFIVNGISIYSQSLLWLASSQKNNVAKKASSNRTKKPIFTRGKAITTEQSLLSNHYWKKSTFPSEKSIDMKQMNEDLETEKCRKIVCNIGCSMYIRAYFLTNCFKFKFNNG